MKMLLSLWAWTWPFLRQYLRNNAVAVDQLVSALTCGDEDETISSRLGKTQRGGYGRFWLYVWFIPRLLVDLIAWPFDGWNHCLRSIEEDEGKNAVFAKGVRNALIIAASPTYRKWKGCNPRQK